MTHKSKTAICTSITVISPLLMMYSIGISSLTLLDGLLMISLLWVIVTSHLKLQFDYVSKEIAILVVGIIINEIVIIFVDGLETSVILRMLRLILYLCWPIIIGPNYFDRDLAIKEFKVTSIFATVFLFAQYILLFAFNIRLPGYVSFLPLSRPEVAQFTASMHASLSVRPRSIFGEPSQYGLYVSCFLCVLLLKDRLRSDKGTILLLFLGMLLSRSTTAVFGVVLTVFLFLYYIIKEKRHVMRSNYLVLFFLGIGGILIIAFLKIRMIMPLINSFLQRLPTSVEHRTEGYRWLKEYFSRANIWAVLWGKGMNENVIYGKETSMWLSSIGKILVYFGIIGTAILAFIAISLFLHVAKGQKGLIVIILCMGFFTEILVSNWLVLFLPFIFVTSNKAFNKQLNQSKAL